MNMFEQLERINRRPEPFEVYSAERLWTDDYISQQLLEMHLDEDVELASRPAGVIDRSVEWMTVRFGIGAGAAICDFGCGPGLYTSRLAERGADVTGIDFSRRSLDYARREALQRNLEIEYLQCNYLDYVPNRKFDLITLIFCDFCVLSPEQRRTLLSVFRKSLKPNGRLLLDVVSLNHFDATSERRVYDYSPGGDFWTAEPCYVFLNTFKYEREKVLLDKHTVFTAEGTFEVFNWLQCYSPESIGREFEANGFRVVEYYDDVAGSPHTPDSPQFAVVARKL